MTGESRGREPRENEVHPRAMQACHDFAAAWQAGQRPKITDYVGNLSEPERTVVLRELMVLDVHYRRQAGESPTAAHYARQFPAHRELIESLLMETKSLTGVLPPATLMQPVEGEQTDPNRCIDVTQAAAPAEGQPGQRTPVQPTSPGPDAGKSSVPLDKFIQALIDSGLMECAELDTFVENLPVDRRPHNGKQLAQELFRAKRLTRFQVQAIYQGKTRGLVIGNYVVLEKLGQGGMGQVYTARHTRMDRLVAIKVLRAAATKSPEAVKRFQREVKAAAKLTHPNIVRAYDADEHRGVHFLVMEYVAGQDLASLVRDRGPLTIKQAVDCVVQAAHALEYAHQQGVIHRDIKPQNLLLDGSGTIKILDMGLARLEQQVGSPDKGLTHSGAVMGTLDYMAPEQAMDTKTADARADIYGLGCTLHYLLTGRPPYGGDSLVAKIVAHRMDPIPSLLAARPNVPETLDRVYCRMLAKTPDDRHASAAEVLVDLTSVASGTLADDAPGMSIDTSHQDDPIDFTIAEDIVEPSSLGALSDKSVDLTQRWAAPSVGSHAQTGSWLQTRKTQLIVGVAAGILGVLLLLAGVLRTLRSQTGDLVVEVNEPDAKVEVLDAKRQVIATGLSGDVPLRFSIRPGQHSMRVAKDGFAVHTEEIEVAARSESLVRARLVPVSTQLGTLVLTVSETDALVQLLGEAGNVVATYRSGETPLSVPLAAGKYSLVIEKPGFETFTTAVTMQAGNTSAATAALTLPAPTTATLVVKVNEPDTLVELLDANAAVVQTFRTAGVDLTIPTALLQGRVRVSKDGFETALQDFTLATGGNASIDMQLTHTPPPKPPSNEPAPACKPGDQPAAADRWTLTPGCIEPDDVPAEVRAAVNSDVKDKKNLNRGPATIIVGHMILAGNESVDATITLGRYRARVLSDGWFYFVGYLATNRIPRSLNVLAFDHQPVAADISVTSREFNSFEIRMAQLQEEERAELRVRVVHVSDQPMSGMPVVIAVDATPSVDSFSFQQVPGRCPYPMLTTDADGMCTAIVPHSITYYVSASSVSYWSGAQQVVPGPGETKEVELRLLEQDRMHLVTVDYVLQPDGSRSFSAPACERGTKKALAKPKGTLGNILRFCLPSDKSDSAVYDVVCTQGSSKIMFDCHERINGLLDLGPVELDSVTEAPPDGYAKGKMMCQVGHVYVVNTYEGRYAKFIVTSIEPGGAR